MATHRICRSIDHSPRLWKWQCAEWCGYLSYGTWLVQFCAADHRYHRSVGYDIEHQGIERDIWMMECSKEMIERMDIMGERKEKIDIQRA